MISSLLPPS
ncbi:hypothetical protein CR513_05869 [Mucuna pruriens]|uniref:Uncharacterized protein n=1 Tax=Mucuna pruriens TaxID=157652 RepID=A0A371I3X4_MUCPR|nr:hypothetical protein CR513_05869 [Mucuna pruriens]